MIYLHDMYDFYIWVFAIKKKYENFSLNEVNVTEHINYIK